MRPTREGPVSPFRRGLLTVGLGVNPNAPDEDPEPPIDWAASSNQGRAFVPFANVGDPTLVQSKTATSPGGSPLLTITLDSAPTIGNILVLFAAVDDDNGPAFTINNGTWTQIGTTVYSGNGTNWPNRAYYQVVTGSTSAATMVSSEVGTGTLKVAMLELSGVDTLDADVASATNTASTTDSVTPTAGQAAIAVSATFVRNTGTGVLTPAGGMTELAEVGTTRVLGVNYQIITSTTGSYTLGSTGAAANSSMIGAIFRDTGESLNWIDAPLAIDGSDSTYEFVAQEHSPFLRHTLVDDYTVDTARLVVSWTSNTSRTLTLQGANEADYSDATTLDTHTYTPTGSLTADTLNLSWSGVTAYRFYQYLTSVENWYRVYESSLYQAGEGAASVASNALALGSVVVQNSAASNYHFVAVSSTAGYWLPHADDTEPVEVVASSGSTETINYGTAQFWDITLTANCTFTVTDPPADQTWGQLVIILRQGGAGSFTVTWPASVQWADTDGTSGGAAPTLFTAVGAVDVVTLVTVDGGITWGGSHGAGSASTLDYGETVDIQSVGSNNFAGWSAEVARADHIHDLTAALLTSMGVTGQLLLSDTASAPPVYGDILVNDDNTDFLYADLLELP
jgi:hypothetical protein